LSSNEPLAVPADATAPVPAKAAAADGSHKLVLRNAGILMIAQVIAMPISVVVNAVMGRFIGPADFGLLYLASTFCSFGFLLVHWGQAGTLPSLVARDRSRAGELLGTALAWRLPAAVVVVGAMAAGSLALGYGRDFAQVLALCGLVGLVNAIWSAGVELIRGFERTDIMAYAQVGGPLLGGIAVIGVLVLGGGLPAVLLAQAATAVVVLALVWKGVRSAGVRSVTVRAATLRELATAGVPFLVFGITMELQSNIDAMYMSKLVPHEVVGWLSAARRLLGVLVQPASAIIIALYPTLCRLHAEDNQAYVRTSANALRSTAMLAVPLALGCALFPEIGVSIFGREAFGPAEDNLRVMSAFVLLVYFSMPLGSILLAGGKQRAWSAVQALCLVFSLVLDPLLIPWFQERTGNGGLGVCVAGVASEVFMVGLGVWLAPPGVFNRALLKQFALVLLAGAAMAGAALLLGFASPFVAAPVALGAYAVCLYFVGALDREMLASLRGAIARKLRRS
jgi:O-antigen/teichoic acid export membrane protein